MGPSIARLIKQNPLVWYFGLVYACVGAVALILLAAPGRVPALPVLLLASWIPNLIGVLVTAVVAGRPGLRDLFGRVVRWRFGLRWYAIALLLPVAITLLAIGVGLVATGQAPQPVPASAVLTLLLFGLLSGATGEELGWRGFALPRLLNRWSALASSLILGSLWWLFHVPAFLLGLLAPGVAPLPFLVGALGLTLLITWVFNNTGQSLIGGFLMHFSLNFSTNVAGVSDSLLVYSLVTVLIFLAAVLVVLGFGPARLILTHSAQSGMRLGIPDRTE